MARVFLFRFLNRLCSESCVIKGLHIPKGVVIQLYSQGVHMDPDVWGPEDPKEFIPER